MKNKSDERKAHVSKLSWTLTLGCLWFRTTANSLPSGEKAGTKAPLDLAGLQGGVRQDIEYVFVTHRMLYPSDLQTQMCISTVLWRRLKHRRTCSLTPTLQEPPPNLFSGRWWLISSQRWKQRLISKRHPYPERKIKNQVQNMVQLPKWLKHAMQICILI